MLLNNLALTGNDTCAKLLGSSMSSAQVLFFSKLILFIIILPAVFIKGLKNLKTSEIKTHFVRSLFSVMGGICFYKGLKEVPFADAAALENLQYVIVSLFGIFFFKEEVTKSKLASIFFGFLGAIIITKPELFFYGTPHVEKGGSSYAYIILAIIFWSLNTVTVKILGRTEKNLTQLFYLVLFALIFSFPGAILQFEPTKMFGVDLYLKPIGFVDFSTFIITTSHIKLLLLMAFFYFVHSMAYFNALKRDVTVVIPFRYSKLLFNAIMGYLVFAQIPHESQYAGYVFIILSGLILIKKEVRQLRRNKLGTTKN